MSAPSPWLRPLAGLAIALGVADVALLWSWWSREPALPVVAASDTAQSAAAPAAATAVPAPDTPAGDPATATPVVAEPAAAASAVLYGTFARSDGSPVARGVLWLYRDGLHVDTTQPSNGVYAFAGLQPGEYRISSRVDDALPLDRAVRVEAPRTRLDLQLEPCWVLKVLAVTPDGQPLKEAFAKVVPLARGRSLVAAAFAGPLAGDLPLSDLAEVEAGLGTFRSDDVFRGGPAMDKRAIGVLTLPPGVPVHVALLLRTVLVAQQPVAAAQGEITFTVDPAQLQQRMARVTVRVVDEHGEPVAGCQVSFNDRQTGGGGGKTGEDGRYAFINLVPGRLGFGIMHKTLRGPPISVDVGPGAVLDLGDVVARPWVEVAFTGDFGGEGSVRLTWLEAPSPLGWSIQDIHLSAQNGATLRGALYPGRYAALATSRGTGALFVLDTNALPAQPMRIDLGSGAPLRFRGGRDGQSVGVEVRAQNGAVQMRRRYRGPIDFAVTVPLGSYAITITDDHGVATQRTVQLAGAGAVVELP